MIELSFQDSWVFGWAAWDSMWDHFPFILAPLCPHSCHHAIYGASNTLLTSWPSPFCDTTAATDQLASLSPLRRGPSP